MTDLATQAAQQEARRRAMLGAMQIDVWLPRHALPFAAASNPDVIEFSAAAIKPDVAASSSTFGAAQLDSSSQHPEQSIAHIKQALTQAKPQMKQPSPPEADLSTQKLVISEEIPHFNLQLLRAENCLFLIDLRVPEGYQQSDPDYRLLLDMLRAAGIQQAPQVQRSGAPIQWPMLQTGKLAADQGPEIARQTVQYLLGIEQQTQPAACIWLIGLSAMRFAAGLSESDYYSTQTIAELGQVWAIPSLELLIEQPQRKADVWRSMQQSWHLWRSETNPL